MSVAVLVSGSIFREPEQRTSQAGKRYVTCTIKAASADNSSSDFWNALCFSETAGAELMRLSVNERLAVQGSMKIELFEKDGQQRISRTVFVDSVLALHAPPKERKPKKPADAPLVEEPAAAKQTAGPAFFSDDIPFQAAL
jgi:hypothetical protein